MTKPKGKTLRSNRSKMLRALPHALWNVGLTERISSTEVPKRRCLTCQSNAFCLLHEIYWPIRRDDMGHYLSIALNDPMKVSFAAKPDDRRSEERRVKLSFARYVRRNLEIGPDKLSDTKLAEMQARLIAATRTDFDEHIKVLRGEELRAAYKAAVGHTSCMTGEDRQHLLDMYVQNPDQVGLLVFEPEKGKRYRALLWELDDGGRYLDRIYPNDGVGIGMLLRWAEQNGITVSRYQSSKDSKVIPIVSLPNARCNYYPYLDSFRYGKWMDETHKGVTWTTSCSASSQDARRKTWPLYIDGNTLRDLNDQPVPCERCRKSFDSKQLVAGQDGNKYCQRCYDECFTFCVSCGNRHWYTQMSEVINMEGRKRICTDCAPHIAKCKHCLEPWYAELIVADSKMCPHCDAYCKKKVNSG